MSETEFQVLRAGAFTLAAALATLLQNLTPWSGRRGSVHTNLGLWAINGAAIATLCGACACTVAYWSAERGVGLLNATSAPLWVSLPLTVLALDLVSYFWHRANHFFPALWRLHRVHHSDLSFTASTALRFHPCELVLSLPLRLLAVVALGVPALALVAFEALFTFANLLQHGDIRLPSRLERAADGILITPALHRFHHTRAGALRDHNFGTIFAFWDRLLGTRHSSSSAVRVEVGVPEITAPLGLREALLLPIGRS